MDLDTQFYDDSTSCSSSVSVPCGEDIDDLRLGAEANMFSSKLEDDTNSKTTTVKNFVILKETSGDKNDNLNFSYSTISSISDLIDAREGSPEDLLFRLGFASFEGEESHSSILSRFGTCPQQDRKHQTPDQRGRNAKESDVVLDTRDSIIKTQEWLNNHQHVNDSPQLFSVSKEVSGGSKVTGSGPNQGKRLAAQKKRLRWAKSRQSSFDLLPNLEEEETQSCVEIGGGGIVGRKAGKPIGPIRESSQEKEELKRTPNQSAVVSIIHHQDMSAAEHSEFDKHKDYHESRSNDHRESCSCSQATTDQSGCLSEASGMKQLESSNSSTDNVDKDQLSQGASDPSVLHLSPLKRLNLLDMKVDSFELEEIISNDGRGSPNMLRSTKQSSSPMVPNHSATAGFLDHECDLDSETKKPSSSLASSDSSSGFDEGLEDTTPSTARQNSTSSVEEIQHGNDLKEDEMSPRIALLLRWVNDMSRSVCQFGICKYADILQQRLRNFCAMKSKILCASAIAEYVLLKGKERRKLERLEFSTCQSLHPNKRTSSFSRPCNSIDLDLSEKDGALTSNGQQCASMQCDCDKNDRSRGCSGQKSKTEVSLRRRKRQRQVSTASLSSPNMDNANNSNNSCTNQIGSRLLRFSSMPLLHLQSSQQYRKSSCQNYFSGGNGSSALSNSHSSLMSSISDITYLSYRSTSKPSERQMRCEKQPENPTGMGDSPDVKHQDDATARGTELDLTIGCKCSVGSAQCPGFLENSLGDIFSEDGTKVAQNDVIASGHKCQNHKSKRNVCIMDMMQQRSFEHLSQS